MSRFTPAQIDRLLDGTPPHPRADVPADYFERNAGTIVRRVEALRRAVVPQSTTQRRPLRRLWIAAAAVMLLIVSTIVLKFIPLHPAVSPSAGVAVNSASQTQAQQAAERETTPSEDLATAESASMVAAPKENVTQKLELHENADADVLYGIIATLDDEEIDEWEELEDCDVFLQCM